MRMHGTEKRAAVCIKDNGQIYKYSANYIAVPVAARWPGVSAGHSPRRADPTKN